MVAVFHQILLLQFEILITHDRPVRVCEGDVELEEILDRPHRGTAHQLLKLPRNEVAVGGIMIGHYKRGEEHGHDGHERKPLEGMYTMHE